MTAANDTLIRLQNITQRFAGTEALHDVSIELRKGEILCLLGDNGAGKSTLIKIISGLRKPTSGTIEIDGELVQLTDPRDAHRYGIATVHQEVGTIPLMSVGRNFFLGVEPQKNIGPFRFLDRRRANRIALEQIRQFGLTRVRDGEQAVGTLSGGERQALAIARAMYFGARVLILDEPTSALGVKEAATVLTLMVEARKRGLGIVFITHNANHALSVGDRFVVLIHGHVAANFGRGERTPQEVLNLMAGGEELQELATQLEHAGASAGWHSDDQRPPPVDPSLTEERHSPRG